MRAAKYILILLLILLISAAIYFSLKDGSYNHVREIRVDAPPALVYEYMSDPSNMAEILKKTDEDIVIDQEDNTIKYASGQKQGTITLNASPKDSLVNFSVDHKAFISSDEATVMIKFKTEGDGTLVIMNIEGEQSFGEKIASTIDHNNLKVLSGELLNDSQMLVNNAAADVESDIQEAMAVTSVTPNGLVELSGGYYLYLTTESKSTQLESTHAQLKGLINDYMEKSYMTVYGEPHQFFLEGNPTVDRSRVAVGLPVRERIILGDDTNITSFFLEPHSAVKLTLTGDRKNLTNAFKQAEEYLNTLGVLRSELPSYVIYKNSREEIANPADLRTEIYLPVQ